jgi:hypothetical protein
VLERERKREIKRRVERAREKGERRIKGRGEKVR